MLLVSSSICPVVRSSWRGREWWVWILPRTLLTCEQRLGHHQQGSRRVSLCLLPHNSVEPWSLAPGLSRALSLPHEPHLLCVSDRDDKSFILPCTPRSPPWPVRDEPCVMRFVTGQAAVDSALSEGENMPRRRWSHWESGDP